MTIHRVSNVWNESFSEHIIHNGDVPRANDLRTLNEATLSLLAMELPIPACQVGANSSRTDLATGNTLIYPVRLLPYAKDILFKVSATTNAHLTAGATGQITVTNDAIDDPLVLNMWENVIGESSPSIAVANWYQGIMTVGDSTAGTMDARVTVTLENTGTANIAVWAIQAFEQGRFYLDDET